jgi:16S rRNA (adenine1518-N6/adenine1519-N6)-dimethyltransferase
MSRSTLFSSSQPAAHKARKRFGQNFLHDPQIIERIVRALGKEQIQQTDEELLIEIGPGQGALTEPLLLAGLHLTAIEIDRDLAADLRQRFGGLANFVLIEQDVMLIDFANLLKKDVNVKSSKKLRVFGNLPYNISTPLLFHLLQFRDLLASMIFMLQLEVVERMAAVPGSGDYGRLSVMLQYHCKVEKLFRVPPSAFNPPPKVDSAIVKLIPHKVLPHPAVDAKLLDTLVKTAFSQRRKTLRNTLRELLTPADFSHLDIDPSLRAEKLGVADYVKIANYLSS